MAMEINLELLDYVDCKICGKDFAVLSYHLINQHNMTGKIMLVNAYRKEDHQNLINLGTYRPRDRPHPTLTQANITESVLKAKHRRTQSRAVLVLHFAFAIHKSSFSSSITGS